MFPRACSNEPSAFQPVLKLSYILYQIFFIECCWSKFWRKFFENFVDFENLKNSKKEITKDITCVKRYRTCSVDPRSYRTLQNAVPLHRWPRKLWNVFLYKNTDKIDVGDSLCWQKLLLTSDTLDVVLTYDM